MFLLFLCVFFPLGGRGAGQRRLGFGHERRQGEEPVVVLGTSAATVTTKRPAERSRRLELDPSTFLARQSPHQHVQRRIHPLPVVRGRLVCALFDRNDPIRPENRRQRPQTRHHDIIRRRIAHITDIDLGQERRHAPPSQPRRHPPPTRTRTRTRTAPAKTPGPHQERRHRPHHRRTRHVVLRIARRARPCHSRLQRLHIRHHHPPQHLGQADKTLHLIIPSGYRRHRQVRPLRRTLDQRRDGRRHRVPHLRCLVPQVHIQARLGLI